MSRLRWTSPVIPWPASADLAASGRSAGACVADYIATANEEIMVIPMIETAEAAAAIDEICAVSGLEFAFVGPGDLSASLGHIGAWEGPGVSDKIRQIVESARTANVTLGTYGVGPDDVRSRSEQGFSASSPSARTRRCWPTASATNSTPSTT